MGKKKNLQNISGINKTNISSLNRLYQIKNYIKMNTAEDK